MSKTLEKKTLREWRDEAGLTQKGVARKAGVSPTTVWSLENGFYPLTDEGAKKVMSALGIERENLIRKVALDVDIDAWPNDGLVDEAPRQPLKWWRERRGLSQSELGKLAGKSINAVKDIEQERHQSVKPATKRKLANALKVRVDKIFFPGDDVPPSDERSIHSTLRAELREARRALRKSYDFLREDPNIAFKAMDKRDALLKDVEREIRGL